MTPEKLISFLNIIEKLKCNTRHSWTSSGRQESVAEHSHRMCVMAMLLRPQLPEVDIDKVIQMCIIHDFGEAITGDIPAFYKTAAHVETEQTAVETLLNQLEQPLKGQLKDLFAEMDALQTPEAKVYKALDKLEVLVQHNEADISTWIPLEYEANLTYGEKEAQCHPYITELKEVIRRQSIDKINEAAKTAAP